MPNLKKWTVMVYMAGDNNLDPNSVQAYLAAVRSR